LVSFRIPEALPRLHDKVVAEAAEAALKFSLSQKSKQVAFMFQKILLISEISGDFI
jgi:hypothetical protein